jgi:hypothetical protein
MSASPQILTALLAIDAKLAERGVHALSDYWRARAEAFYLHPTALVDVEEVGRGGAKTQFAIKTSIAEQLAGEFRIPAGERHYHVHVTENAKEGDKTQAILIQYLGYLGVRFETRGDAVELVDLPLGFRILACRIGAVSGFRCVGWTADECSKWDNDGVNPSAEVVASIRAMSVTHTNARGRIFSSPLGTAGFFYDRCTLGNTDAQIFGHAASWVANPGAVTEAHTRTLESDPRKWAREYAAIAQTGSLAAIGDPEDLARMTDRFSEAAYGLGRAGLFIDSSSGRGDGWSYGLVQYVEDTVGGSRWMQVEQVDEHGDRFVGPLFDGGRTPVENPAFRLAQVLHVDGLGAFEGQFSRTISFDRVVEHTAALAHRHGITRVFSDQYQSYSLRSAYQRFGIQLVELAWSAPTKVEACATLRRMLRERTLRVEPGEQAEMLKRELGQLEERFTQNGTLTIVAKRSGQGHADRAMLLLLVARAESEGLIGGSPHAWHNRRSERDDNTRDDE